MAYTIIAEDQIKRINELVQQVKELESLPLSVLQYKADPKSWSVLEIIDHLNVAYHLYLERIDELLPQLAETEVPESVFKSGWWISQVIKSIKPKGQKRPFKMGTLARFNPVNAQAADSDEAIQAIFDDFHFKYGHLKASIKTCRYREYKGKKIASAIGPIVRFHLPEAFEFLLVHAERHWLQIESTLSSQQRNAA